MSALVTGWALLAAAFSVVAWWRLHAVGTAPRARTRRRPPIVLLRPVDAPTPLELTNLSTPIDYPGELMHVVLAPFRPRLDSANVRWLPSDPLTRNRKVGHLAYALATLERPRGSVVISIDADVRVDGALLASLADGLLEGADLVTAVPQPDVSTSLPGRALRGLLVQGHHSFAALEAMSVGAKAICGKAIALSPTALAELVRLGDCLGEDLELSSRLHERGLSVVVASVPAPVPQPPAPTWGSVTARFTRWMQVLRAHRPGLFPSVPLLFCATPVLMALALISPAPASLWALGSLVCARLALASKLDPRGGLRLDWLLGELVLLGCWLESIRLGRSVTWRGRTYALAESGRLRPVLRAGDA